MYEKRREHIRGRFYLNAYKSYSILGLRRYETSAHDHDVNHENIYNEQG